MVLLLFIYATPTFNNLYLDFVEPKFMPNFIPEKWCLVNGKLVEDGKWLRVDNCKLCQCSVSWRFNGINRLISFDSSIFNWLSISLKYGMRCLFWASFFYNFSSFFAQNGTAVCEIETCPQMNCKKENIVQSGNMCCPRCQGWSIAVALLFRCSEILGDYSVYLEKDMNFIWSLLLIVIRSLLLTE